MVDRFSKTVLFQSLARLVVLLASGWLGTAPVGGVSAGEFEMDSSGVRGAFSNPHNHARFYHTEGYLNWRLPWHWESEAGWRLGTRLELTGGWMNGRGEDALFGTVGPGMVSGWGRCPVVIEAGMSPTLLGRDRFGNTDYGTVFQITTHAGLTWRLSERIEMGLRFQHVSNGNLASPNPGLNLYGAGLGWRF